MSTESIGTSRNGLAVLWDVIVAPRAAFEAIAERPRWGWAFLITAVLGMVAAALQVPASEHITRATLTHQFATDPQFASMPSDKQQQLLNNVAAWAHYQWLAIPVVILVATAITALVMTIFKAGAGGQGTYGTLFALAMNVALIYWGFGSLFVAALTLARGPEQFTTSAELFALWPSLAWLPLNVPAKVEVLLGGINVFSIWSGVLLTLGFQQISHVSRPVAAACAAVIVGIMIVTAVFSIK